MNIVIKCAGNNPVPVNADNLNIQTAGDLVSSPVVQQIFGVGDDMVTSVNGSLQPSGFVLTDGDVVTLSTKGHDKGSDTSVVISSGGNKVSFELADLDSTTAGVMASELVKLTFGLGDDFVTSVNGGRPTSHSQALCPGDTVVLSTVGHDKG